jgi:nitrilase
VTSLQLKDAKISQLGRKWFAKYYNSSIAIPSPEFDKLCSIAAENKVLLSVGIIEKEGGTLYCTAVLIDRDGSLLYAHRKVNSVSPNRFWQYTNSFS